MTTNVAIWEYAKSKDLGCIVLDAAGRASVTRKPKGGVMVWATFSDAKKVARFINRKPVASFADVEAAAKFCRVHLTPHTELARRAERL